MRFLKNILGKRVIIADGVLGSLIHQRLGGGFVPDELNLLKPDFIESIHEEYAASGADFISSNTFGASRLKLKDFSLEEEFHRINTEGIKIARRAATMRGKSDLWVAGNMGPVGKLLEPLGPLTFDDVVRNAAEQAKLLEKSGADFILLETIPEIQEFRASVVGILSVVKIPLIATMAFPNEDRSLSGTDGSAFGVISEFEGLAAVGANCGGSMEHMRQVMKKISEYSSFPLICQPNAGIPSVENGRPVFHVKPEELADFLEEIYGMGVSILGSCCGSTPEFTKKISERFRGKPVVKRNLPENLILSTRTKVKVFSKSKMFIIGERINPSGRKKLRLELEEGKFALARTDALEQEKSGADALDVNINIGGLDSNVVKTFIGGIQDSVGIPLVIDSMDPVVIESFAKIYAGKGLVNSISGEESSLRTILPLVRKYNLAFIGVLMDEDGVPESAKDRLKIARKIASKAERYGVALKNIIFDPLVLNAGAEVEKVTVTLETIELLRREFPENNIILGLSNISAGLPNRELVNGTFMTLGAGRGANVFIANPGQASVRDTAAAINFLNTGSKEHLSIYTKIFSGFKGNGGKREEGLISCGNGSLFDSIIDGDVEGAKESLRRLLDSESESPLMLVDTVVTPAMNEVGRRYHDREFFLPQLMASADVVKSILPLIKEKLPDLGTGEPGKTFLFATVKGDVHDIGKNIVVSILESFNFSVIDLGKDVSKELIVEEAVKNGVDAVGLSTLMTTTLPAMYETVAAIKANEALSRVKVFIGGAVVNKKIADEIGAFYSKDAMGVVSQLKKG